MYFICGLNINVNIEFLMCEYDKWKFSELKMCGENCKEIIFLLK